MTQIIDRRPNSKNKSAVNRQRFIKRFKNQIKKIVGESLNKRSITDIERGEKISIPTKDILEPRFHHDKGGYWENVHTGNKEFVAGDHIKREENDGQGQGGEASNSGEGYDEFTFELSREEFLELFFDDLVLPNLVKKQLTNIPAYKLVRAGYAHYGAPGNISILRSLRTAHGRRIALGMPYKEKLHVLEEKLTHLIADNTTDHNAEISALKIEINNLKKKIQHVPFIDPIDLRYHNRILQPMPTTQAVMFCIMDVSGSMDQSKKDIAKRFFILLYLFLTRNYEKINVVFIRHHTIAKLVDEQEFFYSRETGGTVVSSALELMRDIMQEHYPITDWNIYVAQASDGDNWSSDSPYCQELLSKYILPHAQYYAYVEILPRYHQSLWEAYLPLKEQFPNFAMQSINNMSDIYPALRELFKKDAV